ncbi:TetR/AcrR family transcriptional regulator [Nakamurella sp.]|uniref:TetR/AcrR family transcriptional regulator n=1 Tax=Nakamurella sp. TaxID=1869182 RepID=UPI00378407C8
MSAAPDDDVPASRAAALPRVAVADVAVRMFAEHGFQATSATAIAAAAGVSRSTFFRHFRSKEDVIFADHDELLESIAEFFAREHPDPYRAVCEAATMVFRRFRDRLPVVQLRDRVVRQTPELRDRELVTSSRYERLFVSYLRRRLPEEPPLHSIRFAAAVIATHNYELRLLLRSPEPVDERELSLELDRVRAQHGVGPVVDAPVAATDVVVAVFPAGTPPDRLAAAVREQLAGARTS